MVRDCPGWKARAVCVLCAWLPYRPHMCVYVCGYVCACVCASLTPANQSLFAQLNLFNHLLRCQLHRGGAWTCVGGVKRRSGALCGHTHTHTYTRTHLVHHHTLCAAVCNTCDPTRHEVSCRRVCVRVCVYIYVPSVLSARIKRPLLHLFPEPVRSRGFCVSVCVAALLAATEARAAAVTPSSTGVHFSMDVLNHLCDTHTHTHVCVYTYPIFGSQTSAGLRRVCVCVCVCDNHTPVLWCCVEKEGVLYTHTHTHTHVRARIKRT